MQIAAGALAVLTVAFSVYRSRRFPTLGAWWDAEGLPIWIIAGVLIGAMAWSRF